MVANARSAQVLLVATAESTPDINRRAEVLRRASQLPGAPPWVHRELARILHVQGQHGRAVARLRHAILCERDPRRRAEFAAALHRVRERSATADLRGEALQRLNDGELQTAEQLLHSARREHRSPALDYRLLGEMHRQRGDTMAALAANLLAREYETAFPPAERRDQ
ncbi:MAG TPA: hypothetical protein ENI87_00495 [bacterium]|nr:hypothetical protein [bacterium]